MLFLTFLVLLYVFYVSFQQKIKTPKNLWAMQYQSGERKSAFSIRLFLKEFCVEFMNGAYNPMMRRVKVNESITATNWFKINNTSNCLKLLFSIVFIIRLYLGIFEYQIWICHWLIWISFGKKKGKNKKKPGFDSL